ncbi:prepilin-type N-terminal cleavage/methylation domain-containing protein [Pseudoluteimonas lycopersici]|uniref:Prepilin-type N-terminal cleavage/methylation domain-containing protein n=1 Tax=Pseudoluteimonas lycopersici TaxID=1324796 RepID=A0A516V4H7_9GAMM|nr:prepilin-type N-terminal cleavage/methylation domain-containing protein [Lysobacter lycopersici]QDQ73404.1 prepilin-type N-terminal cleavage/methylation domain-containing protein [Lysobacter lycopersici]
MTRMPRQGAAAQRGFTMVELMVSLLLGLLVVAAAGSLFMSNKRVYGATESINRIQENQRGAFEILARDIREAAGNPCMRFDGAYTDKVGVELAAPDATFWSRFPNGVFGQDGTGANGSDEITLYSANSSIHNVEKHAKSADAITVSTATDDLSNGQLLMVCNNDYAIAFSAVGITPTGTTIGHNGAANCGNNLTRPSAGANTCALANANPAYCFWQGVAGTDCPGGFGTSPAYVSAVTSALWTVANNGRGGTSLYRTNADGASEIAEGVTALKVSYKVGSGTDYMNAAGVVAAGGWSQVQAVHVQMTFQAVRGALGKGDVTGTDNAALSRTLDDYIVLRNHQDIQ